LDELIPRSVLFGDPDRTRVTISPDGRRVAFLAPLEGALELFVRDADGPTEPRPLTRHGGGGVRDYAWLPASDRLVFVADAEGDENWQLRVVEVQTAAQTTLVAEPGVQARLYRPSRRFPDRILVGLNDRVPQLHDLWLVQLDGTRELLLENEGFTAILADHDYRPRYGIVVTPQGGQQVFVREGEQWRLDADIAQEDSLTTGPQACTADGRVWYWLDSRDRDTAALVEVAEGARMVLTSFDDADVDGLVTHPTTGEAQIVSATRVGREHRVLDAKVGPALQRLREHRHGELSIVSRSDDDARWIVHWEVDDGPGRYALFETATQGITELFANRADLEGLPLRRREGFEIPTRDGLSMVSYLTRPPGEGPHPLVLLVHGGPWARDEPGYDAWHQLLANRGYAVLSPNFRGSTGFGKAFVNAGDREWAGRMHDDLLDAVEWAVQRGVTTRDRVAIVGGSYGGYATLVGLTFTPEVFACGVDIVGPSSLLTLIESVPPYWESMQGLLRSRVGDDTTEEGRAELWARSPLSRVEALRRPLLIAQGANDPRVKEAESQQIVDALRARDIPVRYARFPDEGHGFVRAVNRLAFVAEMEAFLAEHLGGRAEPAGDDLAASSMVVA